MVSFKRCSYYFVVGKNKGGLPPSLLPKKIGKTPIVKTMIAQVVLAVNVEKTAQYCRFFGLLQFLFRAVDKSASRSLGRFFYLFYIKNYSKSIDNKLLQYYFNLVNCMFKRFKLIDKKNLVKYHRTFGGLLILKIFD